MAHNERRAYQMQQLNVADLKKRVDAGSLSSAAALHELHRRGVAYVRKGVADRK